MKRWKVYMVVGFRILAIGCASGCADKKVEIEPIKMVAEVQKAEDERKVVEKRIQTIAKEEDHVESENRKEELSEKQEDIEKKPVEKTVDTSPKQVSVSEKKKSDTKKNDTKEVRTNSDYEEEKRNIPVSEQGEESSAQNIHIHEWEEQTEIIHHEAVIKDVWIEEFPAWEEEVPVYEQKEQAVCVTCGIEIEGNPNEHLNDVCRQWRNEMKNVQTGTETVFHEAKGHEEKAIVQEAYDETIPKGYKCKECGAVK